MDVDAILKRHPEICLADELAHTNVPGSKREKRWRDVQALLDAGINVFSTMNVQHLESLNDPIFQMTGVRVRETVPDWVMNEAEEVVMADVTPRALRHRLERGAVYSSEKARQAMENFFTEANLTALREVALRQIAHEVEDRLENDSAPSASSLPKAEAPSVSEPIPRIMICISAQPASAALVRRGKRVADYLQADCLVVYVAPPGNHGSSEEEKIVEEIFRLAETLHLKTRRLVGKDVARTLADFAREQGVSQLFLGRSQKLPRRGFFRRSLVDRVVRLAPDRQITIVGR
jgi:two-component system sensor histidine kinase KdpD